MILTVTIISYALFAGLLLTVSGRIKKIKAESGALLMQLKSDSPVKSIVILVLAAVLIGVVLLRKFPLHISIVFDAAALLATYVSVKDISTCKNNGVFENMIICDTTAIKYDDILSLPTVAYEKDAETTQVDFRLLEVLPKKGAKIQLIFPSEEIRNQALEIILKQCPRLK